MENVRIAELNKNDVVQFQCANKKFSAFVNRVYGISELFRVVWKKVDMQEEQDMVHEPPHYQFGKFSARVIIELVGKTYKSASVFYHVGNALKYLMRAPRKNGLEDLKKAKQSVEFAIENGED